MILNRSKGMNFQELRQQMKKYENDDFTVASTEMQNIVFSLSKENVTELITEIGVIPEDIVHDSSEEKLYSKTSDMLFAKALECMDFDVEVLRERIDAADIVAKSKYHSYSLVGDAKAFRLSRTAKNAKDFKVDSMVQWKGSNDFAVLACPYFQYPIRNSQIYKEALNGNVMLFSWEWLYIMLKEGIRETRTVNLKDIWNQSASISTGITVPQQKDCFIPKQDDNMCALLCIADEAFTAYFSDIRKKLRMRGGEGILYYRDEIERVKALSRDDAIGELLVRMRLDSKIEAIQNFINKISDGTGRE